MFVEPLGSPAPAQHIPRLREQSDKCILGTEVEQDAHTLQELKGGLNAGKFKSSQSLDSSSVMARDSTSVSWQTPPFSTPRSTLILTQTCLPSPHFLNTPSQTFPLISPCLEGPSTTSLSSLRGTGGSDRTCDCSQLLLSHGSQKLTALQE